MQGFAEQMQISCFNGTLKDLQMVSLTPMVDFETVTRHLLPIGRGAVIEDILCQKKLLFVGWKFLS